MFKGIQNKQGSQKTWDEWVKANSSNINYVNGKIDSIRTPNWHGSVIKGSNAFNFSGIHLHGITIFRPFAEGLKFSNAIFEEVYVDEGDFSRADFSGCRFVNSRFNKTIFTDASFQGAEIINCNLNRVNLSNANFKVKEIRDTIVYGISAWDLNISDSSVQSGLVIEKTYELFSEILQQGRIPTMVDNIELAQFIYYLTNHKKMRDTINIFNKRGVLLLGRFNNGGLERLYQLRNWFVKRNYLPMIFDFDRPESLDYSETVITMSGLSRMVVADLSGGSVPHELHAIVSNFRKPVVVCYEQHPYSMLKDLKRKNRYFHEINFDGTTENLLAQLPPVIAEAESDFEKIIVELAKEYN